MSTDSSKIEHIALRCLGGQPISPEVAADLALVGSLPIAARRGFYRVLGPCLRETVPDTIEAQIDRFCREVGADPVMFSRAVGASRFLLRKAALADLSEAELADDVARLGDEDGELRSTLVPGYGSAKQVIRGELARGTLADHGKVVERLAWRLDRVVSSSRGGHLELPVAVVSLWYRDGDKRDQVTLQLTAETVSELREMCERFS